MAVSRSSIKLEGDDKVLKALTDFFTETESAAGEVLTEAAEILKDEAVKLAPGPTGKNSGKYAHPPGTLKESIQVGRVIQKNGRVSQAVGVVKNRYFTQNDGYYARFQEFGTEKMLASPFMRPAKVRAQGKIRKHVAAELKSKLF